MNMGRLKSLVLAAAIGIATLPPLPSLADEATEKLAREYVNMPEVQQMIDDMFSPESMGAQMAGQLPPGFEVDYEKRKQIGKLMSDGMQSLRPRMQELMASNAAEVFSEEELQALIDFYGSEHGAAVMAKMQPYFQKTMAELAPDMREMQKSVVPQIMEILKPAAAK
jgi:hypothetical protein